MFRVDFELLKISTKNKSSRKCNDEILNTLLKYIDYFGIWHT